MRAVLACALLLAACGPCPTAAKPAAAAAAATPAPVPGGDGHGSGDLAGTECVYYGLMGAGVAAGSSEPHAAYVAAHADFSAGLEASVVDQHEVAAARFLACARGLRAIPDDDWVRDAADGLADVCYYDAMASFANGGRFASEGRAQLEQAATDDPRLAAQIRGYLADPLADCASR